LRDADIFHDDIVYLRDINSDTSTAWDTYTGGVASLVAEATQIAKTPSTDALGSYADRLGIGRGFFDDLDLLLADSVDVTRTAPATPITVTPAVDGLNNWADSLVGGRQRIGWLDSVIFDKQTAGSGAITVNPSADSLNNYAERLSLAYLNFVDGMTQADALTVERRRVGWFDSTTIDRQVVSGSTPINVNPAADSLNAWSDSLRNSENFNLTGDSMPLADLAPTIDERGILTANVPADNLGLYADQAPTIDRRGILTANPAADPLNNWVDALANSKSFNLSEPLSIPVDAATVLTLGGLTVGITDSLNNWADFLSQSKSFSLSADSLNNWADSLIAGPASFSVTLTDSLAAWNDLPAVSTGAGQLVVVLPPDSLGLYADQAPTVDERGAIAVNLSADSLGLYADQAPTIDRRGILLAAPTADSLGLYADQAPSIDRRGFLLAQPAADAMTLADSLAAYLVGYNFTDSLQNWTDAVLASTGAQKFFTGTDALGSYADTLAVIRRRLGWLDSIVFDEQTAGAILGINVSDSLANYADSIGARENYLAGYVLYLLDSDGNFILDENGNKIPAAGLIDGLGYQDSAASTITGTTPIIASLTDALNQWADSFAQSKNYGLSDAWGNLADQTPTIDRPGVKLAAPPADSMTMADSLTVGRGFVDALNLWIDTIVGRYTISAALSEDINNWADVIARAGGVNFIEPLNNWSDQAAVTLGKSYGLPADAMTMADQPVRYGAGITLTLLDNLAAYADRLGEGFGLIDALPVYADAVAVVRIGNMIVQLVDASEQLADSIDALYLAFDAVVARVSDSLANWNDVVEYVRGVSGIHLSGRIPNKITLAGKIKESVPLSGRVKEDAVIQGRLFGGES
jgi:hypothetical protein